MRNFFPVFLFLFASCGNVNNPGSGSAEDTIKPAPVSTQDLSPGKIISNHLHIQQSSETDSLEADIISLGLVNIRDIDSSIVVDLKYSGEDNFLGFDVYGSLDQAYLQPEVATKLKNAQSLLKKKYPFYSLIVFDAVRPRRIQRLMWDTVNIPEWMKPKYLSNPVYGSLHNFGAAVDVGIIDDSGFLLDMGTPFDHFNELAHPELEEKFIEEGKLTYRQVLNRELLREVMERSGFFNIQTEWWHFNSCRRNEAFIKYKIVE